MSKLLLIDVALGVLLITLAGWVIIGRRRRERDRASLGAAEPPGTATELADEGTAGPATAVVPGFGDDPAEPDPGPGAPAGPVQAAEPPASGMTGTVPDPGEPRAKLNGLAAEPDGQRAERDARGAEPQAHGANGSAHDPDGPGTEPDAPGAEPRANGADGSAHDLDGPGMEPDALRAAPNGQSAAGNTTVNDRIGSYYDEADRPISDYLTAMGWTEEQETRRTR
jgi:hypothetical protein